MNGQVEDFAAGTKHIMTDCHFVDHRPGNSCRRRCKPDLEDCQIEMDLSRDRSPQQTKCTASPKTPKQWHRRQCPHGFRVYGFCVYGRTAGSVRYGSVRREGRGDRMSSVDPTPIVNNFRLAKAACGIPNVAIIAPA
jgi:hypothetical protein